MTNQFATLAEKLVVFITDTIEAVDTVGDIDVDHQADVLNIHTTHGTFVINKQSAVSEIWLVSPISGPYHFAYNNGAWLSKQGYELFSLLSKELQIQFN